MATFPGSGSGKMAVPLAFLAVVLSGSASEVNVWTSIGPQGGGVSALAADPKAAKRTDVANKPIASDTQPPR